MTLCLTKSYMHMSAYKSSTDDAVSCHELQHAEKHEMRTWNVRVSMTVFTDHVVVRHPFIYCTIV